MSSRWMGWFWDRSPVLLGPPRRLKRWLSILLYLWRSVFRTMPPRVVVLPAKKIPDATDATDATEAAISHPAISVYAPELRDAEALRRFLADQTETSTTLHGDELSDSATFSISLDPTLGECLTGLPPTWIESQLLAAAAERLDWTVSGWATPERDRPGPEAELRGCAPLPGLVRLPRRQLRDRSSVLGRAVPHITGPETSHDRAMGPLAVSQRVGPHYLDERVAPGTILRRPASSLERILRDLPTPPGPRTALFLLPFLAVGGAEQLLFDLLRGLVGRYRCLVVTLDPHRHELGQTVDICREITPWVYTLGDWLPQESRRDALGHLIRRYHVETLISWNGTVTFYEEARMWHRELPDLRLVNQLFNHEGGWIDHYGPRLVDSVDLHIAVNGPIGVALAKGRGVPEEKLAVIHHAVQVPPELTREQDDERRLQARQELALPESALIIGSFLRFHPQKRPLDIIRLARRMSSAKVDGREIHFLLAGGGPLDAAVDAEIAANPPANLTRLALQNDVEPLFAAVDLCLMTSAFEGLPVFLLESLARCRPCVATDVGDIAFLFEGGGGRCVDRVGDLEALEGAVLDLLSDPERFESEKKRGRENVLQRFGLERYVRDYESAIFPDPSRETPS